MSIAPDPQASSAGAPAGTPEPLAVPPVDPSGPVLAKAPVAETPSPAYEPPAGFQPIGPVSTGPQPTDPQPSGPGGPDQPMARARRSPSPLARTRTSSAYVAVAAGVVVLILLLIFIIQNLKDASFHYLGLHFRLPVGVLMLAAMVVGGVIVLLVSLARVAQLRVRARRAVHSESSRGSGSGRLS